MLDIKVAESRFASPDSYMPKHLAEEILTSKAALEGKIRLAAKEYENEAEFQGVLEKVPGLSGPTIECGARGRLITLQISHPVVEAPGQQQEAHEHLTTTTIMYRELDMQFWVEQVEAK